jgi:hypothetical protein
VAQTVKELLLKFGIDNSNWKRAIQELAQLLDAANSKAAKQQAQAQKNLEQQKAKLREIQEQHKASAAELEKQVAQQELLVAKSKAAKAEAEAKLAQEKLATGEIGKQVAQQKIAAAAAAAAKVEATAKALAEKTAAAEIQKQILAQRAAQAAARTVQQETQNRLAQERLVTAELQKQRAQIQIQFAQQRLARVPAQAATAEKYVLGASATSQAEMNLRMAMADKEAMSTERVLQERKRIVALAEQEVGELRAKGVLSKEETAQASRILSIRQSQLTAIKAATRQEKEASASSMAISELNLRLAQGEKLSKVQIRQEHEKIVKLLDIEISQMRSQGAMNASQIAQLGRIVALRAQQAKLSEGGAAAGFGSALLRGAGAGLLGGPTFLAITSGVLAAQLLGKAVEGVVEKLKDVAQNIGPLQQVKEQFDKLATTRGIQDQTKFINELREATHGLIQDTLLYRTANTFMQSSVNASREDVVKLTDAVTGLARAHGKGVPQAVEALNRFFLIGGRGAAQLARATGLQVDQLRLRDTTRGLDSASRSTLQFKHTLEVLTKQYAAMGAPATTFTEALTHIKVSLEDVREAFFSGLEGSAGFQKFIDGLDKIGYGIAGLIEKAEQWGEKVGAIFGYLAELGDVVRLEIKALEDIFDSVLQILDLFAGGIASVSLASSDFTKNILSLKGAFAVLIGLLGVIAATFADLAADVKLLSTELNLFFQGLSAEFMQFVYLATGQLGKMRDAASAARSIREKEKAAWHDFNASLKENEHSLKSLFANLDKMVAGGAEGEKDSRYTIKFAAPAFVSSESEQLEAAKRIAKVKEEIAVTSSKIELEQTKTRIEREKELVRVQYESGLTDLKDYLAQKQSLEEEDFQARLSQLKEEFEARAQYTRVSTQEEVKLASERIANAQAQAAIQKKSLEDELDRVERNIREDVTKGKPAGGLTKEEGEQKLEAAKARVAAVSQLIEETVKAATISARASLAEVKAKNLLDVKKYQQDVAKTTDEYQKQEFANTETFLKNLQAARKDAASALLKIERDRIAENKSILEGEFQEGIVTGTEYLEGRVGIINQEFEAQKKAAEEELKLAEHGPKAQEAFDRKILEAAAEREKALTELTVKQWDIRSKAAEQSFDRVKKLFDDQLQYGQELSKIDVFAGRSTQIEALQTVIGLEQERLKLEEESLKQVQEGTTDWFEVQDRIDKARLGLLRYREELIKVQDFTSALAKNAGEFATAFGETKWKSVAGGLQSFSKLTETLSQFRKNMELRRASAGQKRVPLTPEQVFESLKKASDSTGKGFTTVSDSLKNAQSEVGKFQEGLKTTNESLRSQIEQTIGALKNLTDAANKAAGKSGSATGTAPSGLPTASAPTGTVTTTDKAEAQTAAMSSASTGMSESVTMASSSLNELTNQTSKASSASGKLADSFEKTQNAVEHQNPFQSFMGNFLGDKGLLGVFKNLGKNTDEASADLTNFGDSLKSVVGGVGGLQQAFSGRGGPFHAGMTGLAAGAQLGLQFGGPIGGVIGGGVGLISGVFSGKAKKAAEKAAKEIVAKLNAVLDEVNTGTKTLATGVQQEIQNIQDAVSRLSHKKGGRDELKKILPDMESKLQQLKQQQQQIITSFDTTLEQLRAPQAYRDTIGQVQQLIDKYRDYVNAGGSVQLANQYLQLSFQNLVQNGLDQLNQDEQDAINNALRYNDLLWQRQNLIQDTNLQIQQIMSQGVAVRQTPEGVSRAIQIQQLMRQRTEQFDQLNEEIGVSHHKLEIEQKIFGLATTRIGLETQLLSLQNAQTDKSTKQILELESVVRAYSTATPTNLPTALSMLGLGNAYVSVAQEPGLLPVAPVKTGIAEVDLQNQLEYQQALQYYNQQQALADTTTASVGAFGPLSGMGVTSGGPLSSIFDSLTGLMSSVSSMVSGGGVMGSAVSTAPPLLSTINTKSLIDSATSSNSRLGLMLGLGLSGKAQQGQIQSMIQDFNDTVTKVNAGSLATTDAVMQLVNEKQKAQTSLSTSKFGRAWLTVLEPKFDAAISALQGTTHAISGAAPAAYSSDLMHVMSTQTSGASDMIRNNPMLGSPVSSAVQKISEQTNAEVAAASSRYQV